MDIGGKVAGSQFTVGTDLDLEVGKSLGGSVVQVGTHLTLDTGTDVLGSRVAVGSDADVTIGGKLASSALLISSNLTAAVGINGAPVVKGRIISAGITKSRIETSDGDSDLTVVGPVSGSVIDSGHDAILDVTDLSGLDPVTNTLKLLTAGSVRADVFVVAAEDISVTSHGVGGAAPKIVAGNNVTVAVDGAFRGAIDAANDVDLQAGSVALAATGGTATVGAGMIPTPALVPGGTGSVNVVAKPGLRAGGDLKFVVDGNVVAPLIDVVGNVTDFRVGGGLAAGIYVGGDFASGIKNGDATVVGGIVAPTSFLHIGGDLGSANSASELIFDKGFAGRLEIGGDLLTDLTFNGAVNRIAIAGRVGPSVSGSDAIADIYVKGKLTSFISASLYDKTSANGGNFKNAAGTITGVIQADGGAPAVGPFLF